MCRVRPAKALSVLALAVLMLAALPRTASAQESALLFPFASNQSGFDTGISIDNTTADPFGTAPVSGTCAMTFYGVGAPAQPVTTPTIAAGQTYTSLVSVVAPGFQGYLIVKCQFPLARGWGFLTDAGAPGFSAQVEPEVLSQNDSFASAGAIAAGQTLFGFNVDATLQSGEPNPTGKSGSHSVWWSFTPSVSGPIQISLAGSSFATTLGVYTGAAVNALVVVAQNASCTGGVSYSCVTFNAVAGTTYRILVNGFATATGMIQVAATPTNSLPQGLHDTHDFNGDGKSDILWRNTSNGLAVWLMNGGAIAQSAGLGTLPSSFSIIGQHDFDGDGKADVLWRDGSGNISMWLMNGAAVSSAVAVGNLTANWTLHGTADLNGDGKGDLLWRDSNTGAVAVWFMNGATVASTANFGTLPSNWILVGDANGSILWRDTAGDIALWAVQNGQVTSASGLGTVTSNFVVQGGGDFDGDGEIDILWRDTNTGALSIWFTNGTQVTSAAVVGTLPGNWSVVQVGDYNGDGKSDILLLDAAGDLAVWLMNGATVSAPVAIGNVGTTWQVQNVNAN